MAVKLLLTDDHPIVIEGVTAMLQSAGQDVDIFAARSGAEALRTLEHDRFDVVVTDLTMPAAEGPDGVELVRRMRQRHPELRIVVFTSLASSAVVDAVRSVGADGIVEKGAPFAELLAAIHPGRGRRFFLTRALAAMVLADFGTPGNAGNVPRLSPAQLDVVRMLALGRTNREIACSLGISSKTVSRHKRMAMERLAVTTDLDLFHLVARLGLV